MVKLFRGACGSKSSHRRTQAAAILSSSFAELVDLNTSIPVPPRIIFASSSFAELVDLNPFVVLFKK